MSTGVEEDALFSPQSCRTPVAALDTNPAGDDPHSRVEKQHGFDDPLAYVGLPHLAEELTCVGRKRFDVAALPFRVYRVECERTLPGARDAGDYYELAAWDDYIYVLEVVLAGAPHDDFGGHDLADCSIGPNGPTKRCASAR